MSPLAWFGLAAAAAALLRKKPADAPAFAFVPGGSPLGPDQEAYIRELHPAAQARFRALLRAIEASGWRVTVTSGYRSFAKQAALYAADSRNARPGRSHHNYGLAIDINAANKDGRALRKASPKSEWLASGIPQLAKSMGFAWGGDFAGYYDPVHFDLKNDYPMDQVAAAAAAQFGTDPYRVQGNQVQLSGLRSRTLGKIADMHLPEVIDGRRRVPGTEQYLGDGNNSREHQALQFRIAFNIEDKFSDKCQVLTELPVASPEAEGGYRIPDIIAYDLQSGINPLVVIELSLNEESFDRDYKKIKELVSYYPSLEEAFCYQMGEDKWIRYSRKSGYEETDRSQYLKVNLRKLMKKAKR